MTPAETHDDLEGASAEDGERFDSPLRIARRRALVAEEWIADEFTRIEKELANLHAMRRPKGRQPSIWLQSPSEVLDAVKLGVVTKPEARKLLGLRARRQPIALRHKAAK